MKRNALAAYFCLASRRQELFENPVDGGYNILTDCDEIRQAEAEAARQLAKQGRPAEWASVGLVYEDGYIQVVRDAVRFPDGTLGTYQRILPREGSVAGIAIMPMIDGSIILIRHFRHTTRRWHLEIPRGFGDPALFDEENARRELMEEIGGRAVHLYDLGLLHIDTGMTAQADRLYFAKLQHYQHGVGAEAISRVVPMPAAELEQLVVDGTVTDSFTIAALIRSRLRGLM